MASHHNPCNGIALSTCLLVSPVTRLWRRYAASLAAVCRTVLLAGHPNCLGLGIDEDTAVVVRGHTFTVLGNASVSVCLPPDEGDENSVKLLKSGAIGDLHQLSESVLARLKTSAESKTAAPKVSTLATKLPSE